MRFHNDLLSAFILNPATTRQTIANIPAMTNTSAAPDLMSIKESKLHGQYIRLKAKRFILYSISIIQLNTIRIIAFTPPRICHLSHKFVYHSHYFTLINFLSFSIS